MADATSAASVIAERSTKNTPSRNSSVSSPASLSASRVLPFPGSGQGEETGGLDESGGLDELP
jgi:hypothetical protein